MAHFFIHPSEIEGDRILVSGENYNHIKNVLRMKPGERLSLSAEDGLVYLCKLLSFQGERVECLILDCEGGKAELPIEIILFQGLPKKDKMELIIEKAVELGVKEVVPVVMKRTIVKIEDSKKEEKRLERWRAIALSAAKQSGRDKVPVISEFMSFNEAIKKAESLDFKLIPYEKERDMDRARELLYECKEKKSIGIFIGPEGGISEEELELAIDSGAKPMSLGNRILRTETAGLMLLSALVFQLDS